MSGADPALAFAQIGLTVASTALAGLALARTRARSSLVDARETAQRLGALEAKMELVWSSMMRLAVDHLHHSDDRHGLDALLDYLANGEIADGNDPRLHALLGGLQEIVDARRDPSEVHWAGVLLRVVREHYRL